MSVDGDDDEETDFSLKCKVKDVETDDTEEKEPKKPREEFVSTADLELIKAAKHAATTAAYEAEIARTKREIARLEHQNQILRIYIKYGLKDKDLVSESNGLITREVKE